MALSATYGRIDKKARTGAFHVAICKQSYADAGGERPRAMKGGKRTMTAAEIKLAIASL